ncbi:protein kinase domain-containing protein [Acanthopleuribacter pedis]|uniref:Protein kinase n=1 Tax=Acanthopleuribacter pedis TaxID=442870 RepID=A0A8J7QHJ4_9BACT|nr:protein kinase [Acanthopleuribacter pedis]
MKEQLSGKILVVDDNPGNLDVLSRRLNRKGLETVCVNNGRDAIDHIYHSDFDLVLRDIMMPEVDGLDVLVEARRKYSKNELPIIMVTSKSDSQDIVEALGLGANDYIVKPVDFPVALARIRAQLSQKDEFSSASSAKITYSFNPDEKFRHYEIQEKIGQGGMGAVYKAYDTLLDRIVALKVVLPGNELTSNQIERFTREARSIAKIKHPNILNVYEIGQTPQNYYAMDYIEGRNLSEWFGEVGHQDKETALICAKVASALYATHCKGIIHRDLKPSNIMVDSEDEPHLMDFGLAKLEGEEEKLTRTGDILGTPEYMAPEQVDPGYGTIDNRSDIYSLGVILYEALTAVAPFNGTPIRVLWQKLNQEPRAPRLIRDTIPEELEQICLKAMARQQNDRFQSALELSEALHTLAKA